MQVSTKNNMHNLKDERFYSVGVLGLESGRQYLR